jgi:hypothetical protein
VQAALNELRAKLADGERIDFAELVELGARAKARRIRTEDAAADAALKRLANMVRTRSFPYKLDVEAAGEVKHLRLTPKYE